nr:YrhC family protein [Virgibacillus salarius]
MESKLKDFQRFIGTLLILSSYLYLGAIINTFMRPSTDGKILMLLAFVTVLSGILLATKQRKIKIELEKER